MQGKMDDGGDRISYVGGAIREPSSGKGAYELISPFAEDRLAVWYELGAAKYACRNWEKGIPFSRLIQSAIRHLNKWRRGKRDEDHLAAAAWNIFAMMHFEGTGQDKELNDMPKYDFVKAPIADAGQGNLIPTIKPHNRDYMIIAVDFDGCLCVAQWPDIGAPNLALINELIARRKNGDKVILWTCREGDLLERAKKWCAYYGLEFDAVNENIPEQNELYGNDSRKVGCDCYLDDKAISVIAA